MNETINQLFLGLIFLGLGACNTEGAPATQVEKPIPPPVESVAPPPQLESRFHEAIEALGQLSYELKEYEELAAQENFMNRRIEYLNPLKLRQNKDTLPRINEALILAVRRAQVKSSLDRGGHLYNRATIEAWESTEKGAMELFEAISFIKENFSWMEIDKSPITFWQQGRELIFITPGGFYMLEDVPALQEFLQDAMEAR